MVLRAPGMLALHLALDRVESPLNVRVWDDWVPACDMGALAAQWFSDFAGRPLRLVRFDPEHRRLSDRRWTGAHEAQTAFADGFSAAGHLDRVAGRGQPAAAAAGRVAGRDAAASGRTWCSTASMPTTRTMSSNWRSTRRRARCS